MTYMINLLMRQTTIILQYIVVICSQRAGDFLRYGHGFGELIVGDLSELCAVGLGDNQLGNVVSAYLCPCRVLNLSFWIGSHTAWPLLNGFISRNANTLGESCNLKEGISPKAMSILLFSAKIS